MLPHEPDYIARTIETVRNHKDAENCWPQWANIFADQIEAYAAVVERYENALAKLGWGLEDVERSFPCCDFYPECSHQLERLASR